MARAIVINFFACVGSPGPGFQRMEYRGFIKDGGLLNKGAPFRSLAVSAAMKI
jgi:hypothetical protein